MTDWVEIAYKAGVILILGLFLCLTAWSYLHHRLKGRPRARTEYIKSRLGWASDGELVSTSWAGELRGRDYIVPLASAVLVTGFGVATCLFANRLLDIETFFYGDPKIPGEYWRSILLTGLHQDADMNLLHSRRWQSLTVMSLAFLGAFIWSSHNIIRRYINYDLDPVEYYHMTLRLILAPLLALMLSFLVDAGGIDLGGHVLPVIAFMTGLVPAAVLFFLQDWFVSQLKATGLYAHYLPLSMIQGLNRFHEVRLSEAGIDNAQNLANAELTELAMSTPYPMEQLLDWIDQARLYVHLKDNLAPARDNRIRTASDLIALDPGLIKRLEGHAGLADLTTVAHLIDKDPRQQRVDKWRNALALLDDPKPS